MAVLPKNERREELRYRLIEEAEERLKKRELPPMKKVLEEIARGRRSIPKGLHFPDSTELLRESRGFLDDSPEAARTLDDYVTPSAPGGSEPNPSELRCRLFQEAEENLRRDPKPSLEEVLAEILQDDPLRPAEFGAPDSTTLLREERER